MPISSCRFLSVDIPFWMSPIPMFDSDGRGVHVLRLLGTDDSHGTASGFEMEFGGGFLLHPSQHQSPSQIGIEI
jgi:hypothetical protein